MREMLAEDSQTTIVGLSYHLRVAGGVIWSARALNRLCALTERGHQGSLAGRKFVASYSSVETSYSSFYAPIRSI